MTQSTYFNQVKNVLKVLQGYTKAIRFLLVMFLTLTVSAEVWAESVEMSSFSATSADMDNYISYKTAKGGGTSNPAVNDSQIRLYQGTPGGNITISAKEGVTITEVTIGSGMATKIRWEINGTTDASNTSLAKNAKTTKSGISTKSITCHCYGSDKNSRLYVNYLKVVYTIDGGETPDPCTTPTVAWNTKPANGEVGGSMTASVTTDYSNGLTYSSSNQTVATVTNAGFINYLSAGTTTITATVTGDGTTFCEGPVSVQQEITVTAPAGGDGGDGECSWTLVTDASTLKIDDEIIIAASGDNNYALSTNQKSSNRGGTPITKNGNTLTAPSADVQILTLKAGYTSGTFAFYTGASGYLYAASSSGNQLKTKSTLDVHGSWTISITDGVASIAATGSSNRNVMQYNYNNGSPLFACYASASQTSLAIYKKICDGGGTTTYTITSTLSHVTADGGNPTTITSEAEDLTLTYSAESGWNLPDAISVTMGGNQLMLNDEYTWDKETGKVWIVPDNGFTGNIVVTINGWQQLAAPTGLNVSNITSSGATLAWNAVTHATSYTVQVYGENDEIIAEYTDLTQTTKEVSGLDPETNYVFGVVAVGDGITYTNSIQVVSDVFTTLKATTPTAGYTIIHSRQALDDSYPDSLIVKTTGTEDVGSTITAEKKTYTGFVCNDAEQTITIQEDAAQNVVTYNYVRQSYTLTWDLDGGNIIAAGTPAGTVKYGAPLTAPTVEKAGYRFDHWNPNVPATMQDGNRTYKAFYTQQHTVKWVSQGTVIRTDTYDTGAALEAAPTTGIVECDGKNHVGWTAQGGYANTTAPADLFTESSGTVTADATYYAVYAEGSGGGGTGWTAVTSTSDLEAGATYAISNAATGGTYLSTYTGGNNFPASTTTICPLILGGSEDAWTFQIADGGTYNDRFLTATNNLNNNYLRAVTTADDYSVFTISFDDTNKNAVIKCTGKGTRNILRKNSQSALFACYSSGQDDVYLQKQTGGGGYTNYTTSCATITDITIEGYITEFKQHDEFVFGGKVYAIDEEDNETDVTELATFTGYDMSQAGEQTVTVTYLGHQETYTITVTELPVWNITWSVGGKTDTGIGPREVVQGKTIGECSSTGNLQIPKIPDACKGKYFMGWSASSTVNSDGSDFTPITSATVPETNVTYYAVFAEPTGNGGAQGELFSESFETIEGSGGNDDKWDGNIASAQLTEHGDWEFTYAYKGYECIKLGKASGQGQATTPALGINGSATLTFAAGAWNGSNELLTINLQIVGEGSITPSSVTTLTKGQFTTYTANITDANADTKVQFIAANAANNRFFLDEVKVSGGSSDSYTDYSTSCGTYTVTYYGFNSGGYTTTCNDNPAEIAVAQGETYQIPNCEPTFDPAGLGRTFSGTWNTQANGKGTAYEPGYEFIVNSDITLYAQWGLETTGDIKLPTNVVDLATTDIVVTGGTTLTLPAGTTTINSLTLKGGRTDKNYLMPAIYSDDEASVELNKQTIYFDLSVDMANYYPFAVPFPVAVNQVDYANSNLANASEYATHYVIKRYDGANRANQGENKDVNWVKVEVTETLQPGIGYIITAVPIGGEALIRFPMTITTPLKQTEQSVTVIAHTGPATDINKGGHQRHAGWNFIANPYLSRFAGVNVGNEKNLLNGVLNYVNGEWQTTGEVPYVTIPAPDFSYYEQVELDNAILSPSYAFFVQAAHTAALSFATTGRQQNMPALRAASKGPLRMPLTISQSAQSDRTTLLVSDDYTTAYEIGKDLEKMFGSAEYLILYSLMANQTPLAFCATPWSSAVQSIPLGYRTNKSGSVTIALDASADMSDAEMVLLYDAVTGMTTNLLINSYTFETEMGTHDARFTITITPKQGATTDCEEVMMPTDGTYKFLRNGQLYINHRGTVYTVEGRESW